MNPLNSGTFKMLNAAQTKVQFYTEINNIMNKYND